MGDKFDSTESNELSGINEMLDSVYKLGSTTTEEVIDETIETEEPIVEEQEVKTETKEEVSVENLNPNSDEEKEVKVETKEDAPSEIETLRAEILRLSSLLANQPVNSTQQQVFPPTDKTEPAKEVKVETTQVDEKQINAFTQLLEEGQYLSKDELDQVIDKPELINQAIHKSVTGMVQGLGQLIPQLITQQVNQRILMNNAVREFYDKHSDLANYADFVQVVMRQKEVEMADKTYGEIFEETAKECRKRLGLKETDVNTSSKSEERSRSTKPAFATSKSGTNTKPASKERGIFDPNAADMLGL